jgi:PucR C-terminal helix-turn-helix domain
MSKRASSTLDLDPRLIDDIVAGLELRLDPIIEQLMLTYRERIPSYAAAPPSFLEEVRVGTTLSFQVGLEILRGRGEIDDITAPLEELGRRRAAQGIPLGEALLAWQISAATFWENILELAPDEPETRVPVLTVATRVILELLQSSVTALSAGYLEAEQERVADEEMDLQGIVEILAGVRPGDRHYEERATRRGVELTGIRWCLVSKGDGEATGQQARAWRQKLRGSAVGRIGGTVVAYVSGSKPPTDLPGPYIGIAETTDTRAGFRRARSAALVASHLNKPSVRYENVVPLAMILDGPREERASFVQAQLGALEGDPMSEDLRRSLEAYFSMGQSVAAASRALHVHRHTLEYRLERVSALLGDFREPSRRPFLELALALRDSN